MNDCDEAASECAAFPHEANHWSHRVRCTTVHLASHPLLLLLLPLSDRTREGETDMYFPALTTQPQNMRTLRTQAGGELYIAIGHEVAAAFGLPYAGVAIKEAAAVYPVVAGMSKLNQDMCQVSTGVCPAQRVPANIYNQDMCQVSASVVSITS